MNLDFEKAVATLLKHKENRSIMSKLKKGLRELTEKKSWPILATFFRVNLMDTREREIYKNVCGWFALHPSNNKNGNMGVSIRSMAHQRGDHEGATHERYLLRLLSSDRSLDLCQRLGFVIRMLKSQGIPINYVQLFKDITFWGKDVQLRWAQGFYGEKGE